MNHNFHAGPQDAVHRFLNVLTRDSYVVPHRHLHPPKDESFLVLEGSAAVFAFSPDGAVEESWVLGKSPDLFPPSARHTGELIGIDLPAGVWHTVVALTEYVVCYEVKPGPWDPSTDKEFAPWAPPEHERDAARAFLARILSAP